MKSEFEIAITQLCSDRNLSPEVILEAIEAALVSAYKRNYGANQNVRVTVDPRTGQARVFVDKTAVQTVEDEHAEISLAEVRIHNPEAQIGDTVSIELKPRNFGRMRLKPPSRLSCSAFAKPSGIRCTWSMPTAKARL